VILLAILFLALRSQSIVDAKSLRTGSRSAQRSGLRFLTEDWDELTPRKSLASYNRLMNRDLFKPIVGVAQGAGGEGEWSATLGVLPLGVKGLGLLPSADGFSQDLIGGSYVTQNTMGPWAYVGFSTEDGVPFALLEDKSNHQGRRVQAGDKVEGATALSVARQGIRFIKGESRILLAFSDAMETKKAGNAPKAESKPAAGPANGAPPPNNAPQPPNNPQRVASSPNAGAKPGGPVAMKRETAPQGAAATSSVTVSVATPR
jgi:hypothetical protein